MWALEVEYSSAALLDLLQFNDTGHVEVETIDSGEAKTQRRVWKWEGVVCHCYYQ